MFEIENPTEIHYKAAGRTEQHQHFNILQGDCGSLDRAQGEVRVM